MERVQKEHASRDVANAGHVAQGKAEQLAAQTDIVSRIDNSPLMIAQAKQLQGMFGGVAQLQVEEDEPLQGMFATAQRVQEEEEPAQGKFDTVQRVEEEEPLQGKFASAATAQLEQQSTAKPNNTGLPDNLKTGIESLSGMSMDSVKVHYNSSQPAQLNALAYAQGTDIHGQGANRAKHPYSNTGVIQGWFNSIDDVPQNLRPTSNKYNDGEVLAMSNWIQNHNGNSTAIKNRMPVFNITPANFGANVYNWDVAYHIDLANHSHGGVDTAHTHISTNVQGVGNTTYSIPNVGVNNVNGPNLGPYFNNWQEVSWAMDNNQLHANTNARLIDAIQNWTNGNAANRWAVPVVNNADQDILGLFD